MCAVKSAVDEVEVPAGVNRLRVGERLAWGLAGLSAVTALGWLSYSAGSGRPQCGGPFPYGTSCEGHAHASSRLLAASVAGWLTVILWVTLFAVLVWLACQSNGGRRFWHVLCAVVVAFVFTFTLPFA